MANSTLATSILNKGMRAVLPKLGIAPSIVMHPLEMTEGGLSEVEEKSLAEIGYAIGARQVDVIAGREMSDEEILMNAARKSGARKSA